MSRFSTRLTSAAFGDSGIYWPDFAIECNSRAREAYKEQTGEDGISLPDPVAMSIALDPTIGTEWSEHYGRSKRRAI